MSSAESFHVNWTLANQQDPRSVWLWMSAVVTTSPGRRITGQAHAEVAIGGPTIFFDISGTFAQIAKNTPIMVALQGKQWPTDPVTLNVLMQLAPDWISGTGNAEYKGPAGQFSITAPVTGSIGLAMSAERH